MKYRYQLVDSSFDNSVEFFKNKTWQKPKTVFDFKAGIFNSPIIAFHAMQQFLLGKSLRHEFLFHDLPCHNSFFELGQMPHRELKNVSLQSACDFFFNLCKRDWDNYKRKGFKFVLTGHSMGGLNVLWLAERLEQSGRPVDAVINLMGLPPRNIYSPQKTCEKFKMFKGCLAKPWGYAAVKRPVSATAALMSREVSPADVKKVHKGLVWESNRRIMQCADFLSPLFKRPEIDLERISCPILYIGGSYDFLIENKAVYEMAKKSLYCDYAIFHCNHHFAFSLAEPFIYRLIHNWLESVL